VIPGEPSGVSRRFLGFDQPQPASRNRRLTPLGSPSSERFYGKSRARLPRSRVNWKDAPDVPMTPPSSQSKFTLDKIAASVLAPPERPDEIGRLGGYRVLSMLGKGGMGMVFRAEDPALRRIVALKIMLPEFAKRATAKDRFLREAQLAATLEHDHVVAIHHVGEDRGFPFIAMSFLKGMSLDDWLKHRRPLTMPQILRIGRETAQGLAAAHERGMIHRDIKPANLWLDGSARGRIKILDFGLARAEKEDIALTRSGQIVGTPQYMSPEQAAGDKLDARSDLFSLGIVLYRLCTGTQPFRGENVMAVLTTLAVHEPPAAIALNPEMPPALSELIEKLLRKKPGDRIGTANEVVDAIAKIERDRNQQRFGSGLIETHIAPDSKVDAEAVTRIAASPGFNAADSPDSFISDGDLVPDPEPEASAWGMRRLARSRPALFGGIAALVLGAVAIPLTLLPGRPSEVEAPPEKKSAPVAQIAPPPASPMPVEIARALDLPPVVAPPAPAAAQTTKVNLLPLVDPRRDAVAGNWQVTNDGLECEASEAARVRIPYRPVGEYDFRIVFTRRKGSKGVVQALSHAGSGFVWSMGAAGKWCGFEELVGKDAGAGLRVEASLENGERHESIVQVRENAVRAYLDKSLLFDYPTSYVDLRMPATWSLKDGSLLGVGSADGAVCFHEMEVIERSGPGSVVRPRDPGALIAAVQRESGSPLRPEVATGYRFDVLPLLEIGQDEVEGPWSIDKLGRLCAGEGKHVRIGIPYIPPAEYDLRTSFTRASGNDAVAQILVGGGRQFHLGLGAFQNSSALFDLVAGSGGSEENPTRVPRSLESGKRYESLVQVRKNRVSAYLDGAFVTGLKTDYGNVALSSSLTLKDARTLGLAALQSPVVFHRVEITEISGPGKFLHPDRPAVKAIETARVEPERKKPVEPRPPVESKPPAESRPPFAVAPFDAAKARELQQLWAAYLNRKVEETNSVGMRLRLIPPGEFTMGPAAEDGSKPHAVRLTRPFFIAACETSRGEYARVVPSSDVSDPLLPRGGVTWEDAAEFCRKLSERPEERAAGRRYRLPTEAEWECACRAGTTTLYHFGDKTDAKLANFKPSADAKPQLKPVASYPANAWGLHDMHGNVCEWVHDLYAADYFAVSPRNDPAGPAVGSERMVRGGGMGQQGFPGGSRAVHKAPDKKYADVGFRVVCEIDRPSSGPTELTPYAVLPFGGNLLWVAFSRDGKSLAACGAGKKVQIWETKNPIKLRGAIVEKTERNAACEFDPTGSVLYVGGDDGVLRAWNATTGALLGQFEGHTLRVSCVAVSDNGERMLSSSYDKTTRLWNPKDPSQPSVILPSAESAKSAAPTSHAAPVISCSIGSDWGVSASSDGTVQFWDLTKKAQHWTRKAHQGRIECVVFAPDRLSFATAGHDGHVRIWSRANALVHDFEIPGTKALGVAFSPEGQLLAVGTSDAKIRIFDVATGRTLAVGICPAEDVFAVAFSSDGKTLASAEVGGDRAVRLWDVSALRSSWRPLFDGKSLAGWAVHADKPEFASVTAIGGEPAIRLAGADTDTFLSPKWLCRDFDARIDFRLEPSESRSSGYVGIASLGGQAGLPFRFSSAAGSKFFSDRWRLELGLGEPRGGAIAAANSALPRVVPFPMAVLKPAGEWNRFELIRLDDAVAFRLNDRYLGAFTHLRAKIDGGERDFGRSFLSLYRTEGTVYFRRIEVREIHELPPDYATAP
jgi:serine/threonine protein kinase/formylglycine-generating enzyme required for sulfatase activity